MKIKLLPEGVTQVDKLPEGVLVPDQSTSREFGLELRPGHRLSDLTGEWAVFTLAIPSLLKLPALPVLAAESFDGPLNSPGQVRQLTTPRDIFTGLVNPKIGLDHNSHLWLVPLSLGLQFEAWLGTLAFAGAEQQLFRIRTQAVDVWNVDGLGTFDSGSQPVSVTAAIVELRARCGFLFLPQATGPGSAARWRAAFQPLDNPELAVFTNAWFRAEPKPYQSGSD